MKDKLPCAVVRDLLPSYIDGLTGEETSALVKAHLDSCPECRKTCDTLRGVPVAEPAQEEKMIDYLKKERRRQNRTLLIFSVLMLMLLLVLGYAIRIYIVGDSIDLTQDVSCRVRVYGSNLEGTVTLIKKGYGLGPIETKWDDGVITIIPHFRESSKAIEVHSYASISSGDGSGQKIKKVLLYDRVIWEGGTSITTMTDAVYKTRHPYMGDAPANGKTADALQLILRFGEWKNTLSSAARPYRWTLTFGEQEGEGEKLDERMRDYAYVLLAMVENLDEVCMEYTLRGEARSVTVTTADADAFFGESVKACYESLPKLQKLMDKAMLW
ncbi:MAG: DUF4825 domain-containing protein [Oscillospiraceae bacterium]|nr:DUF4825 domain-containing protein [Oscillospiraceae bacterium]